MTVRSQMVHRATVERNVGVATDPFHAAVPNVVVVRAGDLPCYVQAKTARLIVDGAKGITLADYTMWAPLGSDVTAEDRVTQVVDRRGADVVPHPLRVTTVVQRETHQEAALEEYS